MTIRPVMLAVAFALCFAAHSVGQEPPTYPAKEIPSSQLKVTTRTIPLNVETNRMRGVNFDAHGTAWIATVESDRRRIVKANPVTGESEIVLVTSEPSTDTLYMDHVVPVGDELFVCVGRYPRQILLDPQTGKSREIELRTPNPEIFNALVIDDSVFAFDTNNGIHVWNTAHWTCELIPWPNSGKGPFAGTYVESDHALYCPMWWTQGMAETQPLLRYDLKTGEWTTFVPPWPDTKPMLPVQVSEKLYITDMFGGFMMVFDLSTRQFEARHALPGYEDSWKYAASFQAHGPFVDCSLSTFAGTPNEENHYGFDGRAHHFVNRRLMFDTRDGSAAMITVPSLTGKNYTTVAYSQPYGDSLYLTCVDSPRSENRPVTERGAAFLVEMEVERVR